MFLEKYKKFKLNNNLGNELYEVNSIGDNKLFSLDLFFTREYYSEKQYIDIDMIKKVYEENICTFNKLSFINSFLESKISEQEKLSSMLDQEYFDISEPNSMMGSSFIKLHDSFNEFNYVFENKIHYVRNMLIYDSYAIKNSKTSQELDYYLSYQNNGVITINFSGSYQVNDLLIETHGGVKYSVYGINEKGVSNYIMDGDSSLSSVVSITTGEEYKSIMITSLSDIKTKLKNIKVFHSKEKTEDVFGIIVHTVEIEQKLYSIMFTSSSDSTLYKIRLDQIDSFISDLNKDESAAIKKHLNETNIIDKNYEVTLENKNTFFCVELIDRKHNKTDILSIFGKEQ